MGKKTSSILSQVFIVVLLLLCNLIYHTESTIPSHHEQLSVTGRGMMANTPYAGIEPPPSESKDNQRGRRLENYYKPDSEIITGPSHSGHGGGNINQVSSP